MNGEYSHSFTPPPPPPLTPYTHIRKVMKTEDIEIREAIRCQLQVCLSPHVHALFLSISIHPFLPLSRTCALLLLYFYT